MLKAGKLLLLLGNLPLTFVIAQHNGNNSQTLKHQSVRLSDTTVGQTNTVALLPHPDMEEHFGSVSRHTAGLFREGVFLQ